MAFFADFGRFCRLEASEALPATVGAVRGAAYALLG